MNKKIIRSIILIVVLLALTVVLGFGTFLYSLVFSFQGELHFTFGLIGLYIALITFLWLVMFMKEKRKKLCKIFGIVFVVGVISVSAIEISKQIEERIPVVGDGSIILEDYLPFEEGSKLITYNNPSIKLEGDLPEVDGATALFPVYSAFVQAVYPENDYSGFKKGASWKLELDDEGTKESGLPNGDDIPYFRCTKTNRAYERLINRETDIIFVAGPSDEQEKMAKDAGVELKLTPIGKEAFVFFVNSKNEVDNLSVEQIQKIYSGEITNWKEVGGKNNSIRAFQRPKNSGSQTALERLMSGKELIKPIEEDVIDGMGGIIEKTASYKNYKNAIGYSFRYFSTEMVNNDEIKHIALNGVKPTKETIRDGSYPISSNFYAITLEDNDNPNVEKFIKWILSDEGQYIIEKTGYVGIDNDITDEQFSKINAINLAKEYIENNYKDESKIHILNFDSPNVSIEKINQKLHNKNENKEVNAICWCVEFNTVHDKLLGPIRIYIDRYSEELYGSAYRL